jgi:hypothetical protein
MIHAVLEYHDCSGALNSSFNSTFGERHFRPLPAGKPASVIGNADIPHTYGFVDDVAELLYTFEKPFEVSHDKFEEAFGVDVTSHDEALRKTIDWYRVNS